MTDGAGVVRSADSLARAGRTVADRGRRRGWRTGPADRAHGELANLVTAARGDPRVGHAPRGDPGRARPERLPRAVRRLAVPDRPRRRRSRRRDRPGADGAGAVWRPPAGRREPPSPGDAWEPVLDPPRAAVLDAVTRAVAEDVLPLGDLTAGLVPADRRATVDVVSRATGVVAGQACAAEAFAQIDPGLEVTWRLPDGTAVVARLGRGHGRPGSLRSILTAERTALNFLGHLSGVATLTRAYVDAVHALEPGHPRPRHPQDDTRTAGAREGRGTGRRWGEPPRQPVRGGTGQGQPPRGGHHRRGRRAGRGASGPAAWSRSSATGSTRCARRWRPVRPWSCWTTWALTEVAEAAALVRASGSAALVEVSGGVTLASAPALAAAGADLLSAGALTHSAPVLDLGLDLRRLTHRPPPLSRKGPPCCSPSTSGTPRPSWDCSPTTPARPSTSRSPGTAPSRSASPTTGGCPPSTCARPTSTPCCSPSCST